MRKRILSNRRLRYSDFCYWSQKRAIEDHFKSNTQLEIALRSKGKNEITNIGKNILPHGIECVFVRQKEKLGLGHAVLCVERVVGNETFCITFSGRFFNI
jgi:UTP--glucose-1-phosphate uridylyltransferase